MLSSCRSTAHYSVPAFSRWPPMMDEARQELEGNGKGKSKGKGKDKGIMLIV